MISSAIATRDLSDQAVRGTHHILLLMLFFILFASRPLGFDVSVAPGMSLKNACLYVVFLVLAIETAVTRCRQMELFPLIFTFLAYIGYAIFTWLVISLVVDYSGYSAWNGFVALKGGPIDDLLVFLIFFFGVLSSHRALWLIKGMVWIVVAGNVLTVLDGLQLLDLGLGDTRGGGRVGGTIGPENQFGGFLAFMLPLSFVLYLAGRGALRLVAGIGFILTGLAFVMAMSRAAFVGVVIGTIIGTAYLREMISTQNIFRIGGGVLIMLLLVIVGAIFTGFGQEFFERILEMTAGGTEAGSGRTIIWGMAMDRMVQNPISLITGFGWHAYETHDPSGWAAHNVYLDILYDLGIIGVILYLLVFYQAVRVLRHALESASDAVRPWLMGMIFGVFALLVNKFFGNFFLATMYVWAFLGVSLRLAILSMAADNGFANPRATQLVHN